VKAVALDGPRVQLRPVAADDIEVLARIRSTPDVARWWRARSPEEVQAEWEQAREEGEPQWSVWFDGKVVGFAQAYEETDPDYRHAGIDLYIDPAHHGRGLGQEVTARVARHLFDDRAHHRAVIDPAVANERAIRCYEAVGFRRVGVMRQHWFDHVEQRWADGLLMDLLADELDPGD
jgi:aminoglycoside 6'-N-acetyltransferase